MTENHSITPAPDGPTLRHIASLVLNQPLLLQPDKASVVLEVLQGRIGLHEVSYNRTDAGTALGTRRRGDGQSRLSPVQSGVAIIEIHGGLVNRGKWIGASSGLTSYEGLAAQLREARDDPEVSAIALDIDSPGGEVAGMQTVASLIREVNQAKPVIAVVNDLAASAGYALASASREIVVTPTSQVGSIGVVLTHLDRSGELEQKGVKATIIHAGAHKVDGHPFGPLPEGVRADLQAEVMSIYDQFVRLVAEGRPMAEQNVRDTEARLYRGDAAIGIGLADRVATLHDIIAEFSQPALGAASRGGVAMSNPTNAAPQAENAGITQADLTAAVEAARAEGHKSGANEATARIKGILDLPEAEGREKQALAFALKTSMSADEAKAVLAEAPKEYVSTLIEGCASESEFGCDAEPMSSSHAKSTDIWSRAIKGANTSLGVTR